MFQTIAFPQYPEHSVYVAYFDSLAPETLATVKAELINRNPQYDYCFLNTSCIASVDQLRCSLHKAVQNLVNDTMKARTVNTEIIFNLSPVNNINDALKRFGIDESRPQVIVVKVSNDPASFEQVHRDVAALLDAQAAQLSDSELLRTLDEKKFKKLYKLQNASGQDEYTQGAVAAMLLRGL